MSLSEIVIIRQPTEEEINEACVDDALEAFYYTLRCNTWTSNNNAGVNVLKLFHARFENKVDEKINLIEALRSIIFNTNSEMLSDFFAYKWNGQAIERKIINSTAHSPITFLWSAVESLNSNAVKALLNTGADASCVIGKRTLMDIMIDKLYHCYLSLPYDVTEFVKIVNLLAKKGIKSTMDIQDVTTMIGKHWNDKEKAQYQMLVQHILKLFSIAEAENGLDGAGAGYDDNVVGLTGENNGTHGDNGWDDE